MYVASQSFKASNGTTYRMGDIIDTATFDSFSNKDKAKCKYKADEDDNSLVHNSTGDMLGTGMVGGIDGDLDTPW